MSVKVLVVDDSKVERKYLTGLLGRLGTETAEASDCDESVKLACEDEYDIMFIDYFMPDADGVHALKEIRSGDRSVNRETPAIALGTADQVLGDDFFMMQGFANYLEKPVNYDLLHAALLLYLSEEKRRELMNIEESMPPPKSLLPEWLSEIPELNITDGVKNCGSEEGYMSALTIFHSSIGKMYDEIHGYYDNEDWENYTIKVHALKSSARIIGLAELSELARQLEAAGDARDLDFIHGNTDDLLTRYKGYSEKLSRLSGDSGGEEKEDDRPLADSDFLEDAFTSLEEFAGQMDYDLVEMVMTSLEEHRLLPEDKEIYDAVNEAFMALDWNGIRTAAHRYAERVYGADDSG
ncbi:MAG: response regulator [Ruminiclostridium sp.]|nr:response regulator [Ruminiclostridium sp.]